jgi:hypothetical protein
MIGESGDSDTLGDDHPTVFGGRRENASVEGASASGYPVDASVLCESCNASNLAVNGDMLATFVRMSSNKDSSPVAFGCLIPPIILKIDLFLSSAEIFPQSARAHFWNKT